MSSKLNINTNKIFAAISHDQIRADLVSQVIEKDQEIKKLRDLLAEHGIELPQHLDKEALRDIPVATLLEDGNIEEIRELLEHRKSLIRNLDIEIEFHNLRFSTTVDVDRQIGTVGSMLLSLLLWWKCCPPQREIDILANATGRIAPRKMTLLIGPPGSGKSVLLKALGGRLHSAGKAKFSGEVYYDGDNIKSCGKFLIGKVADYVEQGDTHEAILTVEETLKFAWQCTTGGHHSYAEARDATTASLLERDDETFAAVSNMLALLGLKGCKDTVVGNAMVRGVSGGQKRRVTIGEMMVCPRPIKLMDCISNGLDTATTFDIVNSLRSITHTLGNTMVLSLLQPPPDVFRLFDEVILLSEGHIIYHGPRELIMAYFENLGYRCPDLVDEADFLQELPTAEGRKYIVKANAPHTSSALARAWQESDLYKQMVAEMRYPTAEDAKALSAANPKHWYPDYSEEYAASFPFYLRHCVERQFKVVFRDRTFFFAYLAQSLLVAAITGSLFNNIDLHDVDTMRGFLFNCVLIAALNNFSTLPIIYDQKRIYYKQKDSLFFPTLAFTVSQALSFLPLQIIETFIYVSVVYWSAGLSANDNSSRFFTFILLRFMFGLVFSQHYRLVSSLIPEMDGAFPLCAISVVICVLFGGFIQPKSVIPKGWAWFYWLNPLSWALKAVTVNEFAAPKYNFPTCINADCSETKRFGFYNLERYGNPTDERWIWYSFAVLIAEFLFLFTLTVISMKYVRSVPTPPPPVRIDPEREEAYDIESAAAIEAPVEVEQLAFDSLSCAFRDICYTVTLPSGEDVELLKGVNGFFEPGTITALMGSSGAGKTTLLDVLAGRKNTGVVKGEMFINGVPKVDAYFRKVTAYVEQFDTLPRKSTAREAIAFSAALRLNGNIGRAEREKWVDSVLKMMDLEPLQHELIGVLDVGGMSFEQRKRVSIGVELASNPSILFLDEPTTGLDSRAAQILIHNIRTIAATGRSVVCTIHQPSTVLFNAFDSLLLLMRGGQTVYFGELGREGKNVIEHFQHAPGVQPMPHHMNPATWMLDVIGAGTSVVQDPNATDFHAFYQSSVLSEINQRQLETLCIPNAGSKRLTAEDMEDNGGFNASLLKQFLVLMHRFGLTYWRSPEYVVVRTVSMIILALLFSSAYPLYTYHNDVELVSRSAVIYITTMFCGILTIFMVIPMAAKERGLFYKEQQCRMYSVPIYTLCMFLAELPGLFVGSLAFTLPFFYIVGFDNTSGNSTQKFFWYWFFQFLMQSTMMYLGQFYAALTPNEATSQVLAELNNTFLSLFCGFLIAAEKFPDFWVFMYWLNPCHYAIEGILSTQIKGDETMIKTSDGVYMTAEHYVTKEEFTTWSYDHVGYDVLALCLISLAAVVCHGLCLAYLRHDKR